MPLHSMRLLATTFSAFLLASCGGEGIDIASGASEQPSAVMPTIYTEEGRALNSCSLEPACSSNPHAPFYANSNAAPPDGAVLSGTVRIEVNGNAMANVEVLPYSGYTPRHGIFNISGDTTFGWIDFDTRQLPNGPFQVRASAFNVAAGQPGAVEIVAMSPRVWVIDNPPIPPATLTASLHAAPEDGAAVAGITRLELRGTGIANVELLPAQGYAPTLGVFNVSEDGTRAWLDFDTRALPDGVHQVRISAFNVTEGQPGAREVIAMPPRSWDVRNGNDGSFTARVDVAPAHGAVVSGRTRIEVRGTGLRNVELLPAQGYEPLLGRFNISADRTYAYLMLDPETLPEDIGPVRVSAFNVPPGSPGAKEIVAMPAREWREPR